MQGRPKASEGTCKESVGTILSEERSLGFVNPVRIRCRGGGQASVGNILQSRPYLKELS